MKSNQIKVEVAPAQVGAKYHIGRLDGKPALYNTRRGLVATFEAGYGQTREQDAAEVLSILNSHAAMLEALQKVCENSRLLLSKIGAAGHRQTASGEWVCDPWTEAFDMARAAIAQAGGDK